MNRVEDYRSWTEEDALAASKEWGWTPSAELADELNNKKDPNMRWFMARVIDRLEQEYAEGHELALMTAISLCASFEFIMPEWVARSYIKAHTTIIEARAKSWDDVFGRPLKPRQRLETARKHRELMPKVFVAIMQIRMQEPETPIDQGLFERVGEQLGIGKTLVSELWYNNPYQSLPHLYRPLPR